MSTAQTGGSVCNVLVIVTAFFLFFSTFSCLFLFSVSFVRVVIALSLPPLRSTIEVVACDSLTVWQHEPSRWQVALVTRWPPRCIQVHLHTDKSFIPFLLVLSFLSSNDYFFPGLRVSVCLHINPNKHPVRQRRRRRRRQLQLHSPLMSRPVVPSSLHLRPVRKCAWDLMASQHEHQVEPVFIHCFLCCFFFSLLSCLFYLHKLQVVKPWPVCGWTFHLCSFTWLLANQQLGREESRREKKIAGGREREREREAQGKPVWRRSKRKLHVVRNEDEGSNRGKRKRRRERERSHLNRHSWAWMQPRGTQKYNESVSIVSVSCISSASSSSLALFVAPVSLLPLIH